MKKLLSAHTRSCTHKVVGCVPNTFWCHGGPDEEELIVPRVARRNHFRVYRRVHAAAERRAESRGWLPKSRPIHGGAGSSFATGLPARRAQCARRGARRESVRTVPASGAASPLFPALPSPAPRFHAERLPHVFTRDRSFDCLHPCAAESTFRPSQTGVQAPTQRPAMITPKPSSASVST